LKTANNVLQGIIAAVQENKKDRTSTGLAQGRFSGEMKAMCNRSVEFKCICGQMFDEKYDAIEHIEQLHAGEFDKLDLDAVEDAIEARITPSPLV